MAGVRDTRDSGDATPPPLLQRVTGTRASPTQDGDSSTVLSLTEGQQPGLAIPAPPVGDVEVSAQVGFELDR